MAIPPYLAAAGITAADYASPSSPGLLSYTRPPIPNVPVSWNVPTKGLLEAATSSTSGISAGLPMPDVPGYRYEYPKYTWRSPGGGEEGMWEDTGTTEKDIDKFGYYPYFPGSMYDPLTDADGKKMGSILVGVRLIKE